jgi:hypothetical protein
VRPLVEGNIDRTREVSTSGKRVNTFSAVMVWAGVIVAVVLIMNQLPQRRVSSIIFFFFFFFLWDKARKENIADQNMKYDRKSCGSKRKYVDEYQMESLRGNFKF